jgi:DNA-binding transcriptional regulator YhcF (GntR family)
MMASNKTAFLRQAILERIRHGKYPVGGRLPGVRVLAEEFDVHPNTAARVVANLARDGVVRSDHGRGTYVLAVPGAEADTSAVERVVTGMRELARQAHRLGVTRREWGALVAEAESQAFEDDGPSMWFVECSLRDAEELSQSLSTLLERPVRPLLVDALPHHVVGGGGGGEIFVTTPFHVEEVEAEIEDAARIVCVNVVPTSETLVRFAHLSPSTEVAVVASNRQTLVRFVRMLTTYTRIRPVAAVLVDDPAAPHAVLAADVVIDSHSIHDTVMGWRPTGEVLTIRYQIEPTSLAFLREVLRQRAERVMAAGAARTATVEGTLVERAAPSR